MTHQISLHYRGITDNGGRSDKVYIVTLERHNERYWSVSAAWGRRGGKMSGQNKGMYSSLWSALAAFNTLAGEKLDKGYQMTSSVGSFFGTRAVESV